MNDLLNHRFPAMTGTIYVSNYSWYFKPAWELAKRTLPESTLKTVTFVTASELTDYVPEDTIPKGTPHRASLI